jgi:hypothetical protein
VVILGSFFPLQAEEKTASVYQMVFTKNLPDYAAVFNEEFRKAIPETKIWEIVDLYLEKLGPFKRITGEKGTYEIIFTRGKAPSKMALDKNGRVAGFWIGAMVLSDDSLEKVAEDWKALPGSAAVTLWQHDREPLLEILGDAPLAVGSTFKLYILKMLQQLYSKGTKHPSDVVLLNPAWTSLPSGILQDWPPDAPVTLDTLANLMISLSDNTATDHLLFLIGRQEIEAIAPATMRPFLATREMFRLKYGPEERAQSFIRADDAGKRAILSALATESLHLEQITPAPRFIDTIEWFATTRELAILIHELRNLPALAINPGLVDKTKWHLCAYKGGSEAGVLNYTILLQRTATAPVYSLSATINTPQNTDGDKEFTVLVQRLISLIEEGKVSKP